ncbi:MAG: hypothetical protein RO469_03610 [Thermincola sp.]|nr:hypothetical protein [Thermincola sp.]
MYRLMRYKFGLWLGIAIISWLAIMGGVYLGRFYLGIIRQSGVPESIKVNAKASKIAVVPSDAKVLVLNTVPVYYLQVGVYSDLQGAIDAAKPVRALGYNPYITQTAPFRIWLGVYQKRADTEFIKQQLKEKGVGSFTASTVINGANLRYDKGAATFIQELTPVLEQHTAWLKENLVLFNTDSVVKLNWDQLNDQFAVIEKVYDDLLSTSRDLNTNDPEINRSLTLLNDSVQGYQVQLQNFRQQKNQQSFADLQNGLLIFVDNFQLFWEKVDKVSKT